MPQTLLDRLIRQFPAAKKQTLKRMAAAGRVLVNDRPARRLDSPVADADRLVVLDQPRATDAPPARAAGPKQTQTKPRKPGTLDIVYEDADLLVVNKPSGLLTSTVPNEWRPTLLAAVREYVAAHDARARVGLIHRLDRDAAGLLVFSKTDPAYHALKGQFFHHEVERVYTAVVHGTPEPPAGRIESKLVERTDGTVHSTRAPRKGQIAVTEYEVVRSGGGLSLVKVTLHTGRKHQIRVHLSGRGWPIVGDSVYGKEKEQAKGKKRIGPGGGLLLMATRLSLAHPRTGERMTFQVPMPRALAALAEEKPGPAA